MYARINYIRCFFQAPFFRYVLYGYTLYILYTPSRKRKEYVFFIIKRTLRFQRETVKIAEKRTQSFSAVPVSSIQHLFLLCHKPKSNKFYSPMIVTTNFLEPP